jgi:heterodisulfide reductase subunit D
MKTRSLRNEFSTRCTACGICAEMCPAFAHRTENTSFREVQEKVRGYLKGAPPTDAVLERCRLCDECYQCAGDTCPQGLDPMRVNQLVRGLLNDQGFVPRPFIPPSEPQSFERIISALLTTEAEYRRITTPAVKGDGRVLFFPGCNIYYQPDLLLTAMDVLDLLSENWVFLPGLDHCCGSNYDSAGRLCAGSKAMKELSDTLEKTGVQKIVLWCPTCAARFYHGGSKLPVVSLSRFLADHAAVLIREMTRGGLTLHEACKVPYLGLDPGAPRELLKLLSGKPVREMPRHGQRTVCCGWSLHQHRPEAGKEQRRERLAEAAATGARTLVTVCHGCQWILDAPGVTSDVRVINYIRLMGKSLGIRHPARSRELREMGSSDAIVDKIRENMGDRFDRLPFDGERIREAVGRILAGVFWNRA